MKITGFDLENYRSFGWRRGPSAFYGFDLEKPDGSGPVDVAVIVGMNGSGKTAALQALASFFGNLDPRLGADPFRPQDMRSGTHQAQVRVNWKDGIAESEYDDYYVDIDLDDRIGTFNIDELWRRPPLNLRSRRERSQRKTWTRKTWTRKTWTDALLDPRAGLIIGFDAHRLLPPQAMSDPYVAHEAVAAHTNALGPTWYWEGNFNDIRSFRFRYLKAWLIKLGLGLVSDSQKGSASVTFGLVRTALNSIFEIVGDTDAAVSLDGVDDDHKVWFNSPHGRVPFEALSDGYRNLFVIVVELVYRLSLVAKDIPGFVPAKKLELEAVVLVDDIDAHLHLSCHESLIPRLRKTFPNIQWIATTHSPWIVKSIEPHEVFLLEEK